MTTHYILQNLLAKDIKTSIVGIFKNKRDAYHYVEKLLINESNLAYIIDKYGYDTNYLLTYQVNGQFKHEPIKWENLIINYVAGDQYVKQFKTAQQVQTNLIKKQEHDKRNLILHNLSQVPFPVAKSNSQYSYAIIDVKRYQQLLQDDLDEIENYSKFDANTFLRDNQIKADENMSELDGEAYALLIGQNYHFEDKFGDLGKPNTYYSTFFKTQNMLYPLTSSSFKQIISDYLWLDTVFVKWLKVMTKMKWPKAVTNQKVNLYSAMPVLTADAPIDLATFLKQAKHANVANSGLFVQSIWQ